MEEGFRSVLKKTEEGLAAVLARHELREKELAEREAALIHKERALEAARKIPIKETASINVGGTIFTFGRDTLEKHKDTVLGILLLEQDVPFVDRDPELFSNYIAHFIRHGVRRRAENGEEELVRKEFDFWCLEENAKLSEMSFAPTPNGVLSNGGRTVTATSGSPGEWKCYTYSQRPLADGDVFTISNTEPDYIFVGLCTLPIRMDGPSVKDPNKLDKLDIMPRKKYCFEYVRGVGLKYAKTETTCIKDLITEDPIHFYVGIFKGASVTISQ